MRVSVRQLPVIHTSSEGQKAGTAQKQKQQNKTHTCETTHSVAA